MEHEFVDHLAWDVIRVPGGLHLNAAEHLPEDYLDVLIVDRHTLRLIDLLDLVHHVTLQVILAADVEDVVGVQRSADQRVAGPDHIAVLD